MKILFKFLRQKVHKLADKEKLKDLFEYVRNFNSPVKQLWYLACINVGSIVGLLGALELKDHTGGQNGQTAR